MPPGIVRKFFRSCGIARLRSSLKHPTGLNVIPNRKKKCVSLLDCGLWTVTVDFAPALMRKIVHSSLSSSEAPTWNDKRQLYEMVSAQGTNPHRDLVPPFPFPSFPPRAFFTLLLKGASDKQMLFWRQRTSLLFKFQTHFWCIKITSALSWSCNRVHYVSIPNFQEEILASNVPTKHLESLKLILICIFDGWR